VASDSSENKPEEDTHQPANKRSKPWPTLGVISGGQPEKGEGRDEECQGQEKLDVTHLFLTPVDVGQQKSPPTAC
jgi:hypothetical protein